MRDSAADEVPGGPVAEALCAWIVKIEAGALA